jgi:hypothetical protein
MYKSIVYNKFYIKYCKKGMSESNEIFFFKNIKMFKKKSVFFFNILFENFGLFFIQFHLKKKRIAKYIEIVPKLLTNHQSIMRTLSFLKKY